MEAIGVHGVNTIDEAIGCAWFIAAHEVTGRTLGDCCSWGLVASDKRDIEGNKGTQKMERGRGRHKVGVRELPTWTPRAGTSLRQNGLTQWQIEKQYRRVGRDVWIPNNRTVDELCIINRSRVQFLMRPDLPITGFAALAYYGLTTLVERQEVVMGVRNRSTVRSENTVMCRREVIPECEVRLLDPLHPELACVEPVEALISALKAIRSGKASWFVHDVPGLTRLDIRAIQLVDAVRRRFRTNDVCEFTMERSAGRIDQRWLKKILALSDGGADSPLETTMRLIIGGLSIGGEECIWESQVPLYRSSLAADCAAGAGVGESVGAGTRVGASEGVAAGAGAVSRSAADRPVPGERWLTVADQLCRRFGFVLFFDGAHHREKEQHHRDAEIDAILQLNGFHVLRVTERMLHEPLELRRRIAALVIARGQTHPRSA